MELRGLGMVIPMREVILTVNQKDRENIVGQMALSLKGNFKTA